jgi:lipoyl(octanoyl) transferase
MTSLAAELGREGGLACFRKRMAHRLAEALGARQRLVPVSRLERELGALPVAR